MVFTFLFLSGGMLLSGAPNEIAISKCSGDKPATQNEQETPCMKKIHDTCGCPKAGCKETKTEDTKDKPRKSAAQKVISGE